MWSAGEVGGSDRSLGHAVSTGEGGDFPGPQALGMLHLLQVVDEQEGKRRNGTSLSFE